jgi:CBS domain-containing protein
MQELKNKLNEIAQQLKKGVSPARMSARDILKLLNSSRRGSNVNSLVRSALEKAGLQTQPDFEWAYIDGAIKFVAIGSDEDRQAIATTYRIDGLGSAHRKPVSIKPDSSLNEATTIMMANNFSQLPVMTTEREVKGAISWKSIGCRLSLGKKCTVVRECMDSAKIIGMESSLFEAIKIIAEHDYVLVQSQEKIICGIVTASDLSQQFSDLAEPFVLIGECENFIRRLIHGKFCVEELDGAKNPNELSRVVEGVADLTFGEYVRLLEDEKRWDKLKLSVDRCEFIKWLNRVRNIRNDVMHFDPQGADPVAMQALREFVHFLQELRRLVVL